MVGEYRMDREVELSLERGAKIDIAYRSSIAESRVGVKVDRLRSFSSSY